MSAKTIVTWAPGHATQQQVEIMNQQIQIYVSEGRTDGIPSIAASAQGGNVVTRTWNNTQYAQDHKTWLESRYASDIQSIIVEEQ
jgi:hypothetical protein